MHLLHYKKKTLNAVMVCLNSGWPSKLHAVVKISPRFTNSLEVYDRATRSRYFLYALLLVLIFFAFPHSDL